MKKTFAVLALAGVAFAAACSDMTTPPTPLAAPDGGPDLGVAYSSNATCSQLLGIPTAYEIKIDPPRSGTYGPITATFSNDGKLLQFSSTVNVVAVFVKGGTGGGGYLYGKDAIGANSNPADGYPRSSDSNMGTAGYGDGTQAISHVSFCWNDKSEVENPPTALVVSKTASGSYNRTITWDLTKSVDDDEHSGTAGQTAGTSEWTVTATKNEALSGFSVTGTITISNPNTSPVAFEVNDVLSDGTVAIVTCPAGGATGTVLGKVGTTNGSITCSYTATPGNASATSNNALVTSLTPGVPGGSALEPIIWTANTTGDEPVVVDDDRNPSGFPATIDETTSWSYKEIFTCSSNAADYTSGQRTDTYVNTATLDKTDPDLTASATVTVNCALPALTATKTAAGSYDVTVTWQLTKTVNRDSHSGTAGDQFSSNWTVTATRVLGSPTNHLVSGTITVSNPDPIARTFSVTDMVNGTAATVICPVTGDNTGTVAAKSGSVDGSVTCSYSAAVAEATSNTATISSPGNPEGLCCMDLSASTGRP